MGSNLILLLVSNEIWASYLPSLASFTHLANGYGTVSNSKHCCEDYMSLDMCLHKVTIPYLLTTVIIISQNQVKLVAVPKRTHTQTQSNLPRKWETKF